MKHLSQSRHDHRPLRRTGVRETRLVAGCWLTLGLLVAGCPSGPLTPVDVVALIDGDQIRFVDFEQFLGQHLDTDSPDIESQVLAKLFDQFLDEHLLVRLAVDRGLQTPPGQEIEKRQAITFLVQTAPPFAWNDAELQSYYDDHPDRYLRDEEVHLRQILAPEKALAEAARAALNRGEDFGSVAARFSQGPRAQEAGNQGWLSRSDLPPAFVELIFELSAGELSEIVEADYGYLIFQVVAHEPAKTIPLAEVAGEIQQELLRRHVDSLVEGFFLEARQRYNVEVFQFNLPFEYQGLHAKKETP